MNKKNLYIFTGAVLIVIVILGIYYAYNKNNDSQSAQLLNDSEKQRYRVLETYTGNGSKEGLKFTTNKNIFALKWNISGSKDYSITVKEQSGIVVAGTLGAAPQINAQVIEKSAGDYLIDIKADENDKWTILILEEK